MKVKIKTLEEPSVYQLALVHRTSRPAPYRPVDPELSHYHEANYTYNLKHKKSKDSARMLSVHEFLRDLQLL